jgi:CMP-N-acetylneuraminic acid synthetase
VDAVFTVARARRNPYFNLVEPDATGALKMCKTQGDTVLARQKAPAVYEHIAGVYVLDPEYLRRANHLLEGHAEGYEVPDEKAWDIDSEFDFSVIEFLLKRRLEPQA